jgi:7tm Chemosensory receptor
MYFQADQLSICLNHFKHRHFTQGSIFLTSFAVFMVSFASPSLFFIFGKVQELNMLSLLCWFNMHLIRFYFIVQLSLACVCLRTRFEGLNHYLEREIENRKFDAFGLGIDVKFGILYNDLCRVINIISATFTFPCVLIFPILLLKIIFTAYALVNELRGSSYDIINLVYCGYAIVNFLALIIIPSCEASRLTSSAQRTGFLVSELMNKCGLTKVQKFELIYLTSQIRLKNINVECFLFTINWNVFLTVH